MANLVASFSHKGASQSGDLVEKVVASFPCNGKVDIDDVFVAGVIDIGALVASIADPRWIQIVMTDVTGFKINLDTLGVSSQVFLDFAMSLVGGVPLVLSITTTAPSRIKILCFGD